ncbi:hypothetical protein ACLKA7_015042 [Drosophila subpalustris]
MDLKQKPSERVRGRGICRGTATQENHDQAEKSDELMHGQMDTPSCWLLQRATTEATPLVSFADHDHGIDDDDDVDIAIVWDLATTRAQLRSELLPSGQLIEARPSFRRSIMKLSWSSCFTLQIADLLNVWVCSKFKEAKGKEKRSGIFWSLVFRLVVLAHDLRTKQTSKPL